MKTALGHQILVWVREVAIVRNVGGTCYHNSFFQLVVQGVAVETINYNVCSCKQEIRFSSSTPTFHLK